ncbi:hypothetical protein HY030_01970 [Candidatus Gottesmanbacteria bacterium]|nr:hypothetical protein [Candidatus Gottesmanbacteria bacterium]
MSHRANFIVKKFLSQENLLNILRLGGLLTVAILAPNSLRILKPLFLNEKEREEYYPYSVSNAATKLWRKGLVEVKETNQGYAVKLTVKGQEKILQFELNSLEIKIPKIWDGKWRMVFFDIPERLKKQRNFICKKLKEMNFYSMQESVFIHPFPCENEIEFIREVIGVPHDVKIGTLEKVENDEELRRIFRPILFRQK